MMNRLGIQPTIDRKSSMLRLSRSKTSSLAWCYPLAQVCSVLFKSEWWAELAFEPCPGWCFQGLDISPRKGNIACAVESGTGRTNVPSLLQLETCRLKEAFEAIDQLGDISCKLKGRRWDTLTWRKPRMLQVSLDSNVANKVSVRQTSKVTFRCCSSTPLHKTSWSLHGTFCKPEHRLRTVSIKMEMERLMKMSLNLKSVWTFTFDWKVPCYDAFLWVHMF